MDNNALMLQMLIDRQRDIETLRAENAGLVERVQQVMAERDDRVTPPKSTV